MGRDKLWTVMLSKGIPTHIMTISQKIYKENFIRANAVNGISEVSRAITQRVRKGCTLSPLLFNLYLDEFIRIWLRKLKTTKHFKDLMFNTLLFAGDQFIISDTEDNLQKAVCFLYNISEEYNLGSLQKKTNIFGFVGTDHLRTRIVVSDETQE